MDVVEVGADVCRYPCCVLLCARLLQCWCIELDGLGVD